VIVRGAIGAHVAILVIVPGAPAARAQPSANLLTLGYLSHSSEIGENKRFDRGSGLPGPLDCFAR
jgi:hypothetical protein